MKFVQLNKMYYVYSNFQVYKKITSNKCHQNFTKNAFINNKLIIYIQIKYKLKLLVIPSLGKSSTCKIFKQQLAECQQRMNEFAMLDVCLVGYVKTTLQF